MYITNNCKSIWRHLQQEDKGKHCIVIHAKINYIPKYQNQPVCLRQMLNYQRLWAWCQLCYNSQELILFACTVVIKQRGKYKTWTPGLWTPSLDRVHGPPFMDRVVIKDSECVL